MNEMHYPSDSEIRELQAPIIADLAQKTLYAEYEQPSTQPIDYRVVACEKGFTRDGQAAAGPKFLAEHFQLLCNIRDYPQDGLRMRYYRLGWGAEHGKRILLDLKAAGYVRIEEMRTSMSKGGKLRSVAQLTLQGERFLTAYEARSRKP